MLGGAVHQPSKIAKRPVYEFLATGVLSLRRPGV